MQLVRQLEGLARLESGDGVERCYEEETYEDE